MSNKLLEILLDVKGAERSKKKITGVDKTLGSLGKSAIKTAGAFFGARMLLQGFSEAIRLSGEQQRVEAQLNQVIKSTGGIAGVTAKQVKEMASAFQEVTRFGDETIINASNLMLTFTKVGKDVFPQAIESVLNMSQAMGQDLQQTVIQVGKALNDPIMGVTALRRVGIQLSDEQTNMIKTFMKVNDVSSAQKIILGELETQFGGLAKSGVDTTEFAMAQLGNSIGDLAENLGDALKPAIQGTAKLLMGFSDVLQKVTDGNPSESIREQQAEVNSLAIALANNLDNEKMRETLIGKLNEVYPDLLKNMKDEEINATNIAKALDEHNKKFEERIKLAVAETLVKEKIDESTDAFNEQVLANEKLSDALIESSKLTGVAIDVNQKFEEQVKTQQNALRDLTDKGQQFSDALARMNDEFGAGTTKQLDYNDTIIDLADLLKDVKESEEGVADAVAEVTKFRTNLDKVIGASLNIQDEIVDKNEKEKKSVMSLEESYARLFARIKMDEQIEQQEMDDLMISFDQEALDEEMAELQEALNTVDLELPTPPPLDFGDQLDTFLREQAPAFEAGYDEFINSLTDMSMHGAERRKRVEESVRNAFIKTSGEMLKAHLKTQFMKDSVNKASSDNEVALKVLTSAKTLAIEKATALKSIIVTNAQAIAGIVANMAKATSAVIAGLGPFALLGAPAVIASMAVLTKALQGKIMNRKGFAEGGIVEGVGNTDKVPAVLTSGELVLNSAQQDRLADNLQGQGQTINISISAPLVDETVVDHIAPAIQRALKDGRIQESMLNVMRQGPL